MPTQSAQTIDADVPLGVGDRVRILRGEYRGQSGTIAELPKKLVQLETGARLPGAVIRLSGEELVKMPKVNFERLL
jgi:transcription antitermination factor NusG